jgi:hypothetical protein
MALVYYKSSTVLPTNSSNFCKQSTYYLKNSFSRLLTTSRSPKHRHHLAVAQRQKLLVLSNSRIKLLCSDHRRLVHTVNLPVMPPSGYIDPKCTYENEIPSVSEITPDLFIGNENSILSLDASQGRESNRVGAAISMVHNSHEKWSQAWLQSIIPHHLWIECADTSTQDLLQYMTLCCDFIDARLESKNALFMGERQYNIGDSYDLQTRVHKLSTHTTINMGIKVNDPPQPGVLVRCQVGKSRSTTIVIAYLMCKH